MFKPISLRNTPLADGQRPAICTPLVGHDLQALRAELVEVLPKRPDVLEWRIDFFKDIAETAQVLSAAAAIKNVAPGVPLLFTRRAAFEGGQTIALDEDGVLALYGAVCASGQIDLIDYEAAHPPERIARVRAAAQSHGVGLVLSFHNFHHTPGHDALVERFLHAEQLGADVAKVAVMPRDLDDVLTLLRATHCARQKLRIPLISMAMGPLGAVTRLVGGVFGSALSFAVGAVASAPGQLPVQDLAQVLGILEKAMHTP
ncbi:MAG: type I 3-dehydroquinate dehydratase [Rhodoferax sp.]